MARQSNNHVMKGTRGMFGKQVVFKERYGEQFLSAPPNVKENRKPTPNQQAAQERFKTCSDYSIDAMKDSVMKAAYQKVAARGQTAQNMAFKDAYYPPEILNIISQGYTGTLGNIIVVHAVDDFKVARVNVQILNSNNELIEEGDAATDKHGVLWVYTTYIANANVPGSIIRAAAFDIPGNEAAFLVNV